MWYSLRTAVIWSLIVMAFFVTENGLANDKPVIYVSTGIVKEMEEVETKRYTGLVSALSSVDVVARITGELLSVAFNEGDIVTEGQVLYQLDNTRYEAEVRNLEARIAECTAKAEYAQRWFLRTQNLHQSNASTKDALESAESEYQAAEAALLAVEAQYAIALDDLKNTVIHAPITGKIGTTRYTRGNYLTPASDVLATIIQLDPLRVSFAMSGKDFLTLFGSEENLRRQAQVQLRLANGSVYESNGIIKFLDNQANKKTDAILVFAEFDNPEGKLICGGSVTVMLTRTSVEKLPAVSPSAIMRDSDSPYVYVVDNNGKVERRDVILGFLGRDMQIVRAGVRPGEVVIIDGMHKTLPGGIVNVVPRDESEVLSMNDANRK